MAEIVSLRRARKARERREAGEQAAENRLRFGRSKPERQRQDSERERAEARHQGHRLEEE